MARNHLRLVRFRPGTSLDEALRPGHPLRAVPARDDLGVELRVYALERQPTRPGWIDFVTEAADTFPQVENQSSGAVVLVQDVDHLWGITFGMGHLYLDEDRTEPRFGLRTALNLVDTQKLQQVGTRVYEDVIVSTSRQASRKGGKSVFSIDDARDILRQVVGTPRDTAAFGAVLLGSRALTMTVDVDVPGLPAKLAQVHAAHDSDAYKREFGFIDHIEPVSEASVVAELDAEVVNAVRGEFESGVYLALPEPVAWDDVEGFLHRGERTTDPHPELDLQDYRARVDVGEVDAESLRRHQVRLVYASTGQDAKSWSVYRCLVYETERDGRLYLLADGEWFSVDVDFAKRITEDVNGIERLDLQLPLARAREREGPYNKRAARDLDFVCLDRQLFPFGGNPIEIADLLSPAGHLVHVKRKTQSATLSHLFAQGRVSAEALKVDASVRGAVATHLSGLGRPEASRFVPEYRADEMTVVYAVISDKAADLPEKLPFFSRLNLWHARRALTATLGYRMAITGVGLEP